VIDLLCRFVLASFIALAFCLLLAFLSATRGRANDLHEYSPGMIPPTPAEEADIAEWIPHHCCRSNRCCFKVPAAALHPLSRDRWIVVATGKEVERTGWSRDGQTWRCACDDTGKGWKVHLKANTRCVFPALSGY
jgi:hypothetical protein